MRCSVVIPTYNRSEKLKHCLKALFAQDFSASEFEIVVVDDGSQDDTQRVLKIMQKKAPVPLKFFFQTNQGQGAARNHGIENAEGDVVLLIGDDIVASPSLVSEHMRFHELHPEENAGVLGFITWDPSLEITPLMSFMERGGAIFGRAGGHQFAFDLLRGKGEADYRFFYTSNISLKRSLLLRHKFDPWFSGYGWEDIELGFRLKKKENFRLYYNPEAAAWHDHSMDFLQFKDRMRAIGRGALAVSKKYPELKTMPSAKKQALFRFLGSSLFLAITKYLNKDLYFYGLSKKYFLQGINQEYNKNDVKK